ncbi:MAG: hypothetical protein QW356_03875 [Candidatus Hadarchaeales archaeon]
MERRGRPPVRLRRDFAVTVKLNALEYDWLRAVAQHLGTDKISRVIRYIVNYCMPLDPEAMSPRLREVRAKLRAGIEGEKNEWNLPRLGEKEKLH